MRCLQVESNLRLFVIHRYPLLSWISFYVFIVPTNADALPSPAMSSPQKSDSVRQLGLASATCLVVANMIGTGVFTTSGFLLKDLGSPWAVMLAWLGGGIIATLGALCYGALARRIPESGGEYVFLSRTVHPSAGYIGGWISLIVGFSAPLAAAAVAFGEYTKAWLPGWPPQLTGTIVLTLFTLVHAVSVKHGAWIQNLAVFVKVSLILGFVFLAFGKISWNHLPAVSGAPVADLGVSLVWVSFSYSGWNAAIYIGGEIKEPEKFLPRAMLLGTLLVMVLYLALNFVFVFGAPVEKLAGNLEVGRIAATALGGPGWGNLVTGLVAIALVSSVSAMVMAGPRVYARMAADGYLPRILAMRDGPPVASIILQYALAMVMLWTAAYDKLLTYIGFTLGICTAATVVGLVRLRWREGASLKVPGWPWVPALFLIAVSGMTLFSILRRPQESLVGLGTIALGWIAWKISTRQKHLNPAS